MNKKIGMTPPPPPIDADHASKAVCRYDQYNSDVVAQPLKWSNHALLRRKYLYNGAPHVLALTLVNDAASLRAYTRSLRHP